MSAERALAVAVLWLAGCGAVATLTRPEGDGGWSATRRHDELATIATRAGVDLDGAGPAASAAPKRPAGTLDLPAALALAATRNRRIAVAERQVDVARERVWDARGRLLPSTVGSGRYTWYSDPQTTSVSFPSKLLPPGVAPPVVTIREREFGVANATATVPIDLSGEIVHALSSAQAGYRGERARLWATTLEQETLVIRTYFDLLAAERLAEVTEQTIVTDRAQLGTAQQRFDNGRLTKNELLVVRVALTDAEQERVRRRLAIDDARWTLNETIGVDVDAPTAVADVRGRPDLPPVADALRMAYASNPALVALVEEQQRLEESARSLARSRFPRVSGGGAVDYSSAAIVQPQRVESGFLGLTWDLGTDTRREAQIASARIEAERNGVEIERELRELESSIRRACRSVEERLDAMSAAEAAVGQAEENLRIRQQQFDAGRAQSEDVLDAEALLSRQRATLATALYDAHTRRAELQQLMGLPLEALAEESR